MFKNSDSLSVYHSANFLRTPPLQLAKEVDSKQDSRELYFDTKLPKALNRKNGVN